MLIRNNLGPRKGQVQDLAPAVARVMIADGRAELAFPDQFPPDYASPLHRQREEIPELKPATAKTRKGRHAND